MAWVRIEDAVTEHRKHLKAGPAACWLWVCGIAYCQRQLSDGFIPVEALPFLGVRRGARALADRLVAVGLFERTDAGYRVHDYFDFNDTREAALLKVDAARDQRRQAGLASARARLVQRNVNGPVERALNPIPSHPIPSRKQKQKTASAPHEAAADLYDRAESAIQTNGALKRQLMAKVDGLKSRTKEFIDWFQVEYKAQRHGADYLVNWTRDGPLVKKMLDTATFPQLQDDARIMLSDKCEDKFIIESDRSIGMLSMKFNWLNARRADWELRQQGGTA